MNPPNTSRPNTGDVLQTFADAAADAHGALTELDRHSGDGDFGDNLRGGLRLAVARRTDRPDEDALTALGTVFLDEVGGTSGPLFGLLFTEIARAVAADPDGGWAAGAAAGLAAIQRVGEAQVGDRTLVDALAPAVAALSADPTDVVGAARAAAAGAAGTADLRARMGRASYVGDRAKGAPDPGAVGIALFFWCVARVAAPGAELPSPVPAPVS
jgi:phosphoenolpyruvate---glycerone phosphotransferase subunit DhaL